MRDGITAIAETGREFKYRIARWRSHRSGQKYNCTSYQECTLWIAAGRFDRVRVSASLSTELICVCDAVAKWQNEISKHLTKMSPRTKEWNCRPGFG